MQPKKLVSRGLLASALICGLSLAEGSQQQLDHVGAYNFTVEISGVNAGYFKGVDGLQAEVEVVEFQDGDDVFLRKKGSTAAYGDITLKRGYTSTDDLFKWSKLKPNQLRTVTLGLIQYPTKKGRRVEGAEPVRLCAYTLKDAKLKQFVRNDEKRDTQLQLVAHELTHTCQGIMLEPEETPKRRARR